MMAKSIQGVVVAGAAVALLAACGGGGERAEQAAPPPAPATVEAAGPLEPAVQPAPPARPAGKPPAPAKPAPETKPAPPVVGAVTTTPQLSCDGGWCTVPAGPGTITFRAEVTGANRVEFFLVPTGTETWDLRRSLGVDRDGSDGWSVTWAHGDESVMGHLVVVARGPGGTASADPFNLYRD